MLVACSPLALLPGPPAGRRKGWRRLPALRALPGLTGGSGSSLEESKQQQPAIQQQAAAGQPPPPPPLTAAAANGSGPQQQQQQHASIQHPLFPEAQQPAARPWPVQTQRGIPTFVPSVERDRPCPQCAGTGKVTCGDCRGKGRLNYRGAAMLPQGVKPQWCPTCRASGRWCCAQCMGTGVRRQPIGFRLPHEDEDGS